MHKEINQYGLPCQILQLSTPREAAHSQHGQIIQQPRSTIDDNGPDHQLPATPENSTKRKGPRKFHNPGRIINQISQPTDKAIAPHRTARTFFCETNTHAICVHETELHTVCEMNKTTATAMPHLGVFGRHDTLEVSGDHADTLDYRRKH